MKKATSISEFIYYASWWAQCKIFGKRKPLQTVLFITDRCNLKCRHCHVVHDGPSAMKPFVDVVSDLKWSYSLGSRIVDLEGGEPHLYKDGDKDLNDVIEAAKDIGYFNTTVTTNGTVPITAKSDMIWVSLDGLEEFHDDQRGKGCFAKLEKYVAQCDHPNLNVNHVVTSRNYSGFEDVIRWVAANPHLNRLSFSFYTPYNPESDLKVSQEIRNNIIDTALALKAEGLNIMNSKSGLEWMRDPAAHTHQRACWVANYIHTDGSRADQCKGKDAGCCDECGYGMGAEMALLMNLNWEMVKAGLSVRS